MGVDLSDPQKIFFIMSQGFYSNPKVAIVQELASNMLDAYSEIGLNIEDNPAFIIFSKTKLTFRDFGMGISVDRMEKVMSKFFASTKDKNSNTLGAFGLTH